MPIELLNEARVHLHVRVSDVFHHILKSAAWAPPSFRTAGPCWASKSLADFVHQVQLAVGLLYLPVMTPIPVR